MAEAAIEDVAHDAGVGAGPGAVRPQRDALGAQMLGELALGHARLDDGIGKGGVDLADAVHPAEVEDDVARRHRAGIAVAPALRSEAHTSELQSLKRISSAVFCLK